MGGKITVFGGGLPVNALALTPDGRRVVAGGIDGRVRVWDLEAGAEVLPGLEGGDPVPVLRVAVSPDGAMVASAGVNGAVVVWALEQRAGASYPGGASRAGLGIGVHARWQAAADGGGRWRYPDLGYGDRGRDPDGGAQVANASDVPKGERGAELFRRCGACHTVTPDGGNRAGPTLYGLFGRGSGPCRGIRIQRR